MLSKTFPHRKTKFRMWVDDSVNLATLRSEIHKKIPPLGDVSSPTFSLQYRIPVQVDAISLARLNVVTMRQVEVPRTFLCDEDVGEAFRLFWTGPQTPSRYFQLILGCPPQPKSSPLPDPSQSSHFSMVSFFAFRPVPRPGETIEQLQALWSPFRAFGRVYVAEEGINAQMAIPSNVLPHFQALCASLPLLRGISLNVDPVQLSAREFHLRRPFKALHIRRRQQIVVDGLTAPLDWCKAGTELSPEAWERAITQPEAVVLDCRNGYESDIGTFKGAIPLNTVRFQDSWTKLTKALAGKSPDTPVVTYCTGGIR